MAAVVGAFDLRDDRDLQLFPCCPYTPIQNVLLEEAEEGFHRGIVFAGGDPAHGSKQLVSGQHLTELLGSELAGPVGVDDAGGDPPRA